MAVSSSALALSNSPLSSKLANSLCAKGISIQDSEDNVASEKPDEKKCSKPAYPYIRICPHMTLTFEQFHQIATTPLLQGKYSLDILVKLSLCHPPTLRDTRKKISYEILPESNLDPNNTSHWLSSRIHFLRNPSLRTGFYLTGYWEVTFHASPPGNYRYSYIRETLQQSNLRLCPHIKAWNGFVDNTIFKLLDPTESEDELYRPKESVMGSDYTRCTHCETTVQVICLTKHPERASEVRCLIRAKRFLGRGLNENDPFWLNQRAKLGCSRPECSRRERIQDHSCEVDGNVQVRCKRLYLRGIIHPVANETDIRPDTNELLPKLNGPSERAFPEYRIS